MANFLGRLIYGVGVDESDLDRGLGSMEGKVQAALNRLEHEDAVVQLKAEDKELQAALEKAKAKRDELNGSEAEIRVKLGDYMFKRQVEKVEAEIDRLSLKRANIAVRIDEKGQLTKDAKRIEKDLANVDGLFSSLGRKVGSARANIGPFTLTLKALVPVLTTLAPLLVNIGGAIVAVAGSAASAAAGGLALGSAAFAGLAATAGGFVLAVKPAITDFKTAATASKALRTAQLKYGKSSTEAQNAQKAFNNTLAGMPPQASKAARAWSALSAQFQSRTGAVRNDFFTLIAQAIKTAQSLLPTFTNQLSKTADVATRGLKSWLAGMRSAEAHNILGNIMGNFREALPSILHGLGQFATGIARISSTASDFLPQFLRGFDKVGTEFAGATDNAHSLHTTIGGLMDELHSWDALIGATGKLLMNVLVGGAKAGQSAVDDLTKTFNTWNAQLATDAGQRNLHAFFGQAVTMSEQFAGTLRRLATFFYATSRATAPLATGVLDVVNALGDIATTMIQVRPLRAILAGVGAAMATMFIVGKVQAFTQAIAGAIKMLPIFAAEAETAEAAINPLGAALGLAVGGAVTLATLFSGSGSSSVDKFTRSQRELHRSTQATTQAIRAEHDAVAQLHTAHLDAQQATLNLQRDEEARRKALTHLNNVQNKFGKDSTQAKHAQEDYKQTVIDVKRDEVDRSEALARARREQQKATNATLNGAIAVNKNIRALTDERDSIRKSIRGDQARIQSIVHQRIVTGDFTLGTTDLKNAMDDLGTQEGHLKTIQGQLRTAQGNADSTLSKLTGHTKDQSRATDDLSGKQSRATQGGQHWQSQLRTLGRTLGGVSGTSHGMGQMIGQVTNKILQGFGAKHLNFSLPSVSDLVGNILQRGGMVGAQRKAVGGFIVPGIGDGDRYQTAMAPGSYVLNRNATAQLGFQGGGSLQPVALEAGELAIGPAVAQAIGYDKLDAINKSIPRFAAGGEFAGMKPDIIALTQYVLKRFGGYMSAGYATSGHASNSYHYQGLAADIVPNDWAGASRYVNSIGSNLLEGIYNPGDHGGSPVSWKMGQHVSPSFWGSSTWAMHLTHIHVATQQAIKAVAAQIKKIAVKGPKGPLRDMLQAQADKLRAVANSYIRAHAPMEGAESLKGFHGDTIRGKVSWFTGGATAGGGNASTDPGIAVNLKPGTDAGWNNPTTQNWMQMAQAGHPEMADVAIQGHEAALPIIDLGPAGSTGRAIDVTGPGVRKLGMSTSSFPTDSIGTATLKGGGKQLGGMVGLRGGGTVGDQGGTGHGHGPHPGHHHPGGGGDGHGKGFSGHPTLPPKPKAKHGRGTGPGSWYSWYQTAIDYWDQLSSLHEDKGMIPNAITDKRKEAHRIVDERDEVKLLIKNIRRKREHYDRHHNFHFKKFKFRNKQKGESHHDYHRARHHAHHDWQTERRKAKKAFDKEEKARDRELKQSLPDLYHQRDIDLPFQWQQVKSDIERLKGDQAETAALDQQAYNPERYAALAEFGGNFAPMGFSVRNPATRTGGLGITPNTRVGGPPPLPHPHPPPPPPPPGGGIHIGGASARTAGVRSPGVLGLARAATGLQGAPLSSARAAGSVTHVKHTVINNHFKTMPPDPHTWSAGVNWEMGALS